MRITRTTCTRLVLPAIALGALLLSGCGGNEDPADSAASAAPSSSATENAGASGQSVEAKNTVDVDFVTNMIPHHGQAIEMADLALTKASSPKVKDFAGRVKAAQGPEIATLSSLLSGWGEPVPAVTGSMPGMDHSDGSMMSTEQMGDLDDAAGAEFDRMWVDMMIAHHKGAVRMSQEETQNGGNEKAQQLAQAIADAQTKEIGELQLLRTDLV